MGDASLEQSGVLGARVEDVLVDELRGIIQNY